MKRLILMPESPGDNSGYQIVVKADIEKLNITENDYTVFFSQSVAKFHSPFRIIQRRKRILYSLYRLLKLKPISVLPSRFIRDLKNVVFDEIFCGDIVLYEAVKEVFPETKIILRLHNCYSLIRFRQKFNKNNLSLLFRYNLIAFSRLEEYAFKDSYTTLIFITQSEKKYYNLIYPSRNVKVWEPFNNPPVAENTNMEIKSKKIIWIGNVSSHKRNSLIYFKNTIYPNIHKELKGEVEFHLYGKGTQYFDDKSNNIFGHGFVSKKVLEEVEGGIFINPDLTGGGIKIKLSNLIKKNVDIISTPYGIEGYELFLTNKIIVSEIGNWHKEIIDIFKKLDQDETNHTII